MVVVETKHQGQAIRIGAPGRDLERVVMVARPGREPLVERAILRIGRQQGTDRDRGLGANVPGI